MIKLKNILKESPDDAFILRHVEGDKLRLRWSYTNATAFYIVKNKAFVSGFGEIHTDIIHKNLKELYNMYKDDQSFDWIVEQFGTDRFNKALNGLNTTENTITMNIASELQTILNIESEMSGRYWDLHRTTLEGIKNPYLISFWIHPSNNAQLKKCLRLLKLPITETFVELDPSHVEGWGYTIPAVDYKSPKVKYVPSVKHELPPHLR